MPSTCKEIQEQFAGYVDQELEPAQASRIAQHLQNCPGCTAEVNAQQSLKTLVHERARHAPAPIHLRAAIRRQLAQETAGAGFWAQLQQLWQRRPLPALATAVVLMLLSATLTYFVFQNPARPAGPSGAAFIAGYIEGEVVCIDCDLLDALKQTYTHDETHRVGVRCHDGKVWSILQSPKGRELMHDVNHFHKQVRVTGNLFQDSHYIEVQQFSVI
ncbi:MAG: hypothetical protein ALAOOOJD_02803 [bacterium]|nr:hypothetical protein [bacterium]